MTMKKRRSAITDKTPYTKRFPWVNYGYSARQRCEDEKVESYKYYGAKGIRYHLDSHELAEIWKRDNASEMKQPSLDRIDPKGHYEFNNCRFIELSENVKRAHRARTHCKHGHLLSENRVMRDGFMTRICRVCVRLNWKEKYKFRDKTVNERNRKYRARKRQAIDASIKQERNRHG